MREGDVVLVVGNLDDRIRNKDLNEPRSGTVVGFTSENVIVLLSNGDLWVGPKREVVADGQ